MNPPTNDWRSRRSEHRYMQYYENKSKISGGRWSTYINKMSNHLSLQTINHTKTHHALCYVGTDTKVWGELIKGSPTLPL
jgi:hypothetical protein